LEEFFDATYYFIHDAKAQGGKVLVVCDDGISYSPAILAAFLMREEGMNKSDAVHRIKRVRTTTSLSALHQQDLKVLEDQLIREGVIET
jgi:protein-tyrosine phosphatase